MVAWEVWTARAGAADERQRNGDEWRERRERREQRDVWKSHGHNRQNQRDNGKETTRQ